MGYFEWEPRYRQTKPDALYQMLVRTKPGIKRATKSAADEVGAKAQANLAAHRYEGQAKIEVEQGAVVDAFVNLVDPNALSIEFGHNIKQTKGGPVLGYVPGLGILRRAAFGG